jgi:hypothetical protein
MAESTKPTFSPLAISTPTIDYPRASLLGLPAELRILIYEALFPRQTTADRLQAIQADRLNSRNAHVLQVCRQLYHECAPLAYRTLLIVPERYGSPAETACAFPLTKARLLGPSWTGGLHDLYLRDVVVRDFLDAVVQNPEAGPAAFRRTLNVEVETVYLTLCLCRMSLDGLRPAQGWWLPEMERETNIHWANVFCSAVKRCAYGVMGVNTVVVYFCGLQNTARFGPSNAVPKEIAAIVKRKLRYVEKGSDSHLMPWYSVLEEIPLENCEGRAAGEMTRYRLTFTKTENTPERSVSVEFYDSFTECGKGCILA